MVTRVERVVVRPPAQLLKCADRPAVPPRPGPGKPRRSEDVMAWEGAMVAAHGDCKAKLEEGVDRFYREIEAAASP